MSSSENKRKALRCFFVDDVDDKKKKQLKLLLMTVFFSECILWSPAFFLSLVSSVVAFYFYNILPFSLLKKRNTRQIKVLKMRAIEKWCSSHHTLYII